MADGNGFDFPDADGPGMTKVWKSAIVGYGVVGDWHGSVMRRSDAVDLVAVCDTDADNVRAKMRAKHADEVPVYASLSEMFDRHSELEAVHVATPSGDHLDPAVEAMRRGKHVICEKPLEINTERCDRLIAAAREHGVRLAGIFQNRWRAENRAIKAAVDAGRFGPIAYAGAFTPWWRTDGYYRSGGWRGTWALDGGGAIMNQSVHYVDMLQWLAGPVARLSAVAGRRAHHAIEVEDTLCANVEFESGAYGVIVGSTALFPGFAQRMEIGGPDGTVMTGEIRVARFRDPAAQDNAYGGTGWLDAAAEFFPDRDATSGGGASPTDVPADLHQDNVEAIYAAWARGEEAETSGVEARKAVAIINALYESAAEGGRVVELSNPEAGR